MNKERMASLIFLAAGIYGLIFAVQLPMGKWKEPGAGIFPLCLSMLLCISGILWLIYGKSKGEGKTRFEWRRLIRNLKTPLRIVAVTSAFILSLNRLGYLFTSILYMFVLFSWVSRYRLWISMGLSIFFGLGSWYFFVQILEVQLPRGVWIP